MENDKLVAVAVVGPTNSGKTDLGVAIAKKYNGVIISADSRQVYKGLDVGTNKEGEPGQYLGREARYIDEVPQLLIDLVDINGSFTLYDWLSQARELVRLISAEGRLPVIVGGTGLYVSALLSNWQLGPANPELRAKLSQKSLEELQYLADQEPHNLNDSDYANPRRLIRQIERLSSDTTVDLPSLELDSLTLMRDLSLDQLYSNADKRIDRVVGDLLVETGELIESGASKQWLDSLGLDYRCALRLLEGSDYGAGIDEYKRDVRRYVRRQLTWWAHHGEVVKVSDVEDGLNKVDDFLQGRIKSVK